MKALKFLTFTLVAVFFASYSNAQTTEQASARLTEHHTTIKIKSEELQNGTAKDKKVSVDEMSKHVEGAKKQHALLQKKMTPEQITTTKEHHATIVKHHKIITTSTESIKQETIKPNPDGAKIKAHAKKINESATAAEKENIEIKKKTVVVASK